jgi:hypothetical protein
VGKSIVQVATDGAGKKLDTRDITGQGSGGTDTVHRQVVTLGDDADGSYTATVESFGRLMTFADGGHLSINDAVFPSRSAYVSENGRLRVGMDTIQFYDAVDGTTLQHNLWNSAVTTQTIAQANSFITLNNGAVTTINTNSRIESTKDFIYQGTFPLYSQFKFKTPNVPQANAIMEIGFLEATGAATPTQGAFFRWSSTTGFFMAMVNTGGTEINSLVTIPTINDVHIGEILVQNRLAVFWIDGVMVASLNLPTTVPTAWTNQTCPWGARVINMGTAPAAAPQLSISEVCVSLVDLQANREYSEQFAIGMARGCYQKPVFATDWGQTAFWSNTAQATGVALSNTAAPAGFGSSLGGDFAFQQPAGSATDLILFAYQVPTARTLVVRRVVISPIVVTAAAGVGGPIQIYWFAGVNASAVSLATAESPPTTWSPRRVALGMTTLTAAPAIGTVSNPNVPNINDFTGGVLVVESGRFFHIGVKIPVGTATVASIWRGNVMVIGTFE